MTAHRGIAKVFAKRIYTVSYIACQCQTDKNTAILTLKDHFSIERACKILMCIANSNNARSH